MLRLLLRAAAAATASDNARIVGGSAVDISSVPYLINLRLSGAFICGGALVKPTHVVTAAHCVKGVAASKLLVVGGATLLSDAGVRRKVEKVYTPKAYNARTLHTDVAVLKLATPLTGANIATIGLCSAAWKAGDLVKISGWGQTSERGQSASQQLRNTEVALVSRQRCISQYKLGHAGTITNTMFCASVAGVKDACDGDSGGPAVYQGQLCGIVSWGVGCARRNFPGVYTNVNTVRTFIDKALSL